MTEFTSLRDLESYISEYERNNFVQLWKRDARTIIRQKRLTPQNVINADLDLKYYTLTFACSRGGRKFKTKGVGIRKSFTGKDDCPMNIKVKLSSDGQKLQIVSLNENHNHSIDKDTFLSLPKQRRLNVEEKVEVENFLQLECNKKLLQAYIQNKTGKSVQLSDIGNLKSSKQCSVTTLENVYKIINVDNNITKVFVNENETLLGIYYQTSYMQSCFASYPELLMLDATYKLNNSDMNIYVLTSINGNNEGDPVAIFAVTEENSLIISHMIRIFKECNPYWHAVKTIFIDIDFGEKSILYEEFPCASHLLCLFHVLKRFRMAVSKQTMNMNGNKRKKCLKLLEKIAYSKTEAEYQSLHSQLRKLNNEKLTEYFDNIWHNIRKEWVQCYTNQNITFGVQTTYNVQSFSHKMKQLCDKFVNLESFFENVIILLNSLKTKRNHNANSMLLKKQVTEFKHGSPEYSFFNLLTPQASELVNKSIENCSKYDVSSEYTVFVVTGKENSEEKHEVDIESYKCTCTFNTINYLPCSHIFAVKSFENRDLYDESLVHKRHLKSTYIQLFKSAPQDPDSSQTQSNIEKVITNKHILTTQQKYKIAVSKCEKIASIISSFNLDDFNAHCTELDTLIECLSQKKKENENFQVEGLPSEKNNKNFEDPLSVGNKHTDIAVPMPIVIKNEELFEEKKYPFEVPVCVEVILTEQTEEIIETGQKETEK